MLVGEPFDRLYKIISAGSGVVLRAGGLRADILRADILRADILRAGVLRADILRADILRAGDLRAGVLRVLLSSTFTQSRYTSLVTISFEIIFYYSCFRIHGILTLDHVGASQLCLGIGTSLDHQQYPQLFVQFQGTFQPF